MRYWHTSVIDILLSQALHPEVSHISKCKESHFIHESLLDQKKPWEMITYSHGHSQTPEEKRSESILNNTVGTMDPYFDSFLTTPLSKFFFKMQLFYFQRLFHNQQVCPSQSWILQNHHYFRSQIDCDNGSIFLKYLRTATFGLPMSVKIWTYAAVLRRDKSSMGRNNKTEQNKKRK